MENNRKGYSEIENGLRGLPDKNPPQDLPVKIMAAISDQQEAWFIKVFTRLGNGWMGMSPFVRGAVITAGLVLSFYGGTQFESQYLMPRTVAGTFAESDSGMNGEAYFYLGRSLLASDRAAEAVGAFQKAEMLQPDNPRYTLWQGAAYQVLGDLGKERQSYQRLIRRRPDLIPAQLNLAHNLLQSGEVSRAGQLYQQILLRNPREKSALYNRALAFRLRNNSVAEARGWREYLDTYRTGERADRALQYLHESGDYSFRRYPLGYKSVILNQKRLLTGSVSEQAGEIDYLVSQLPGQTVGKINIAVFIEGDVLKAKKVAHVLQKEINRKTEGNSVRLSWFGVAEPVKTGNTHEVTLPEGVLIFSSRGGGEKREERV